MRRVRMIIDLTSSLIAENGSLSHREARSLVHCARKAIVELLPPYDQTFEERVGPELDRLIQRRWPLEEWFVHRPGETVN